MTGPIRAAGERARQVAAQAGLLVRDAFDDKYHLERITGLSTMDEVREQMVMTELDFNQARQALRTAPDDPYELFRLGWHTTTYFWAGAHYEAAGDEAQHVHAIRRLNECFSYILSRELLGGGIEAREAFIREFCADHLLEPDETAYILSKLSVNLMARMRIKRLPPANS